MTGGRKHRLKATILLAGSVLLAWLGVTALIESSLKRMTGQRLSRALGTAVEIAHVDVDLVPFRIALYGLRVAQPPGFGDGHVLYVPECRLRFNPAGLMLGRLVLNDIELHEAEFDARVDTNGLSNLQALVPTEPDRAAAPPPNLMLSALRLRNGQVTYRELSAAPERFDIELVAIDADVSRLGIGTPPPREGALRGRIRLTGRIRRPPFPDARWGIIAHSGPFGTGSPPLVCAIRLVGMQLAILSPVLPPNTATVLGGDAADLAINLRARPGLLDGSAQLRTIAGYTYDALLTGSVTNPIIRTDAGPVQYILARSGGTIGNLLGNLKTAGVQAVGGAAGAATELAKGAGKTVEGLGGGLLKTAKGVVTFDPSDVRSGVKGIGNALTGQTGETIVSAGGELVQGVGSVTDSVVGGTRARQWRAEIPKRWTAAWDEAIQYVARTEVPQP